MTWNIKVAELADVDRIAEQIKGLNADVVALQEVDVIVDRTGQIDQARALAQRLDYDYLFAASIKYMRGDYGLAFLTRLPVHDVQRRRHTNRPGPQAGVIALEVTVCAPDGPLRLLNQHSDYRDPQPDVLESLSWFSPDPKANQIWLGDFNQVPTDPGPMQAREAGWIDTLADDPSTTFADRRLDYILITSALATRLQRAWVVSSPLSDHNAVVAEFAPAP